MTCPYCKTTMGRDEPKIGYWVFVCQECEYRAEYIYGGLVFESKPEEPMKPPVRIG